MPELPEVEVIRQGLLPELPGRRIMQSSWSNKRLRLPMPRNNLKHHINGQQIVTIDRRAKYLLLRLANRAVLVIHLGMTGRLTLVSGAMPRERHDHLRLLLDSGLELRFNDARRFGCIMVWPPTEAEHTEYRFFRDAGPEPLGRAFTAAYLQQQGKARSQPVKNFLMDGKMVAGIGNIYANEILFGARIHPLTPARQLEPEQWRRVVTVSRRVLREAIKAGGSTISDFLGAGGRPGYFQVRFRVYRRDGRPCRRCRTTIQKTALAGRATWYCPSYQKPETGQDPT